MNKIERYQPIIDSMEEQEKSASFKIGTITSEGFWSLDLHLWACKQHFNCCFATLETSDNSFSYKAEIRILDQQGELDFKFILDVNEVPYDRNKPDKDQVYDFDTYMDNLLKEKGFTHCRHNTKDEYFK